MSNKKPWLHRGMLLGVAGLALFLGRELIAFPDVVLIPIVKDHGPGEPPSPGRFSHWSHSDYRCYSCHPAPFPQTKKGFTHQDFEAGRYCARCHNGKEAWHWDGAETECEWCHVEDADSDEQEGTAQ